MRVHSHLWSKVAAARRRDLQMLPGIAAAVLMAVASGCGGARPRGGGLGDVPEAAYDHYFFVGTPEPEELTELERRERIQREIERLATPAWRTARANLFRLGKDAVALLIDRLGEELRNEEPQGSSASVRPVPGPTLPTKHETWPLGYVIYTVLLDFIGGYSNYPGTDLPGFDHRDWRDWWSANSKRILVYDRETAAPAYVMDQLAAAKAAMSSRYETIVEKVEKQKEAKAKKEAKREKERAKGRAKREEKAGREKAKEKAKEKERSQERKGRAAAEEAKAAEEVEETEEKPEEEEKPKRGRRRRKKK